MKTHLKIQRSLYAATLAELRRPHPVALERVGFLSAKLGNSDDHRFLIIDDFHSVPDNQYVEDLASGACINSTAIRTAVQRALHGDSVFHVHLHDHSGTSWFSPTDLEDNPRIIASCCAAGPAQPHGMLLLSADRLTGLVWHPGLATPVQIDRVSIVGYPMEVL